MHALHLRAVCEATSVPTGEGCVTTLAEVGASCDDGDVATADDVCDATGACVGVAYTCAVGPCEVSSVPNGVDCTVTYKSVGDACSDGDDGTRGDACDAAHACVGTAYTCTLGPCDERAVPNGVDCTVAPKGNGATCDDNDACTDGDVCREGDCAGSAIDCSSAGDACNSGVCDAQTGACEREPLDIDGCDDGEPEVASKGDCSGGGTPLPLAVLCGILALLARARARPS